MWPRTYSRRNGARKAGWLSGGALLAILFAAAAAVAQVPLDLPPAREFVFRGQEPEYLHESPWENHLETDRDSFTPATTTAGRGLWIVETAYSFIDNRDTFETHSFPELLLRRGVLEWMELRLGWNYEVGGAANSVSGSSVGESEEGPELEREHQISYGTKVVLIEQYGWRPQSAFIAQGFTPTGGPANTTDLVATCVFGWEWPNRWLLDAALRYGLTAEEEDHFNQWAPSVVLKVPVRERWNAHVEYFGIGTDGRAEETYVHFVSPGVHYLVTPDFEVGVRFGWGLNDDSARFFNNVGVGWRF